MGKQLKIKHIGRVSKCQQAMCRGQLPYDHDTIVISFFNNLGLKTSTIFQPYTRTTASIRERHIGHPLTLSIDATASTQIVQERECPHGTSAMPARGAIRQTSRQLSDCCPTVATCRVVSFSGCTGFTLSTQLTTTCVYKN